MKIRFHRTHAVPAKVAQDIRGIIKRTEAKLPDLGVSEADVVLLAKWNPFGVNGNTYHEGTIVLEVDKSRPWRSIRKQVAPFFVHELHHLGRVKAGRGARNLQEMAVLEGLASVFVTEMGYPKPEYASELTGQSRAKTLRSFKKERGRKRYDYPRWFFGAADLPRAAGYRLGTELVADYCKRTGAKPSELVATSASVILKNHPVLK